MATISASFKNNTGDSHLWTIVDTAIDPNAPSRIFQGYLEPGAQTDFLQLYSSDGIYGSVVYARAGGVNQVVDNITDGNVVSME